MRLWASGIVYTYIGIQLLNWLMGLHWLSEFAWPMTILTGISLAIASQPRLTSPNPVSNFSDPSIQSSTEPMPDTDVSPASDVTSNVSEPSISFTIRKNIRPQ